MEKEVDKVFSPEICAALAKIKEGTNELYQAVKAEYPVGCRVEFTGHSGKNFIDAVTGHVGDCLLIGNYRRKFQNVVKTV